MKAHSKEKTLNELKDKLFPIEELYKAHCINWKGTTTHSDEQYSEVIAKKLLDINILAELDKITSITRTKSYKTDNHGNINISESNRKEEIFAKRITRLELEHLGLIIDYQIPLKNTAEDKGMGKIDLISYNKDDKTLFLIELKCNKETLLRAILEIYTYYRIVDKKKLKEDFLCPINLNEIKIIPSVLLDPKCNAYKELKEMKDDKRPNLKALSQSLGIKFFTIEELKTNEIHL